MQLGLKLRGNNNKATMDNDQDSNASEQSLKVKTLRAAQAKAKAARMKAEEDAINEELALQESLERHSNASQIQEPLPAIQDQRQIPTDPEQAAML